MFAELLWLFACFILLISLCITCARFVFVCLVWCLFLVLFVDVLVLMYRFGGYLVTSVFLFLLILVYWWLGCFGFWWFSYFAGV